MEKLILVISSYHQAETGFIGKVLSYIRNGDPVIGKMPIVTTRHSGPVRVNSNEHIPEQKMGHLTQEFSFEKDIIKYSKLSEYTKTIGKAARQFSEQSSDYVFKQLNEITEATGNIYDVTGLKLENLYDYWIENIVPKHLGFDRLGHPILPIPVSPNPEVQRQIEQLVMTSEQKERLTEIIETKRIERNAKKRSRKLS